ncbi:MAG: PEGA domain-containing protein [Candidatus Cloacimonetes bacterium]|nr:PEGA domain-containing protein [Candidatus Cloacimonadota bacterium]MCF7815271.1 PEGA domain-containing protein [Candidatus Cloacimonadota bacterium]MCF7868106.1 PEGA domain-containing protein [Candidatus Cloacimonadota bacterium]MCF7883572.1 PEGA domain-containing protein [Candidatus Cloacimonadota bacterium]
MKRTFLIIFLIVIVGLFAKQFQLTEFRSLPADFHAERNSVLDMDMEYCAAVKVECDVPTDLNLKQKVYKRENIASGVYYFFVSAREQQITFEAPDYEPLTVDVPEGGLEKGVTYYARLESIDDVIITLNIYPSPDRVSINEKLISKSKVMIAPGSYRLQIEKAGFEPIDEEISVGKNNTYFNYTLAKIGQEKVVVVEKEPIEEPVMETDEPAEFKLERFDVVYEITSCEMYEKQIVIELMIENIGDDREVTILGWRGFRTRMFDDAGNEFFPAKFNFANKTNNGDITIMMVNGVPTKASLIFRDINNSAEKIVKLDLGIWMQESDSFRMTFRDIPMEKK